MSEERLNELFNIIDEGYPSIQEQEIRNYITYLQEANEILNNIINELEKELINYIKEIKLKWGNQLIDKGYLDIQITVKNYEDILNKLQELKGSDNNDYNEK